MLEQFVYFGEQENVELAQRYIDAVESTCRMSVTQPLIGRPYQADIQDLKGMRRIPVTGFENYFIFYLPRKDGIDVIRVLHGARDIEAILAGEESDSPTAP